MAIVYRSNRLRNPSDETAQVGKVTGVFGRCLELGRVK